MMTEGKLDDGRRIASGCLIGGSVLLLGTGGLCTLSNAFFIVTGEEIVRIVALILLPLSLAVLATGRFLSWANRELDGEFRLGPFHSAAQAWAFLALAVLATLVGIAGIPLAHLMADFPFAPLLAIPGGVLGLFGGFLVWRFFTARLK